MGYLEDYARTHHHSPSYEELLEEFTRLQNELRDPLELAEEQIGRLRVQLAAAQKESEAKPKLAETCHHLRENGEYCGSVAVKGRDFCPYHLQHRGRRLKMARARARGQRWRLQLPPLEDLYAVQVGIGQVLDALLHEQLDRHMGGLVLYGLQQAATNLGRPREVWENSCHFQSDEQLELPGFEAEFGLPAGMDLDTPPEMAFPESESAAVSERGTGLMDVTSLDVELPELQQREGPEATVATAEVEQKAAAAKGAGASGAGKKDGASSRATSAPASPASVADGAVGGAVNRKEPQPAGAERSSATVADRAGEGRSASHSVSAKSK